MGCTPPPRHAHDIPPVNAHPLKPESKSLTSIEDLIRNQPPSDPNLLTAMDVKMSEEFE
jgi:hypothetical protein